MARVFLSHSSDDKEMVRRIAADLVATGVNVWLDEREIVPGDSISQKVQEGLEGSDLLALALTPASIASGWVQKELQSRLHLEATSGQVVIIPLLLEPCELPALLADKAYVNFTGDYESGLAALLRAVQAHGEAAASARPVTPPRAVPYQARLTVSRDEDGHVLGRWKAEGLDEKDSEPFPLDLPLGDEDMEALRWYLETYVQYAGTGDRARAARIEQQLPGWGEALYDALFKKGDGRLVRRDMDTALERPRPALITIASEDPAVLGRHVSSRSLKPYNQEAWILYAMS